MTILWGAYEYSGGNGMRVGIEVTRTTVNTNSTSVTFTYDVYTQNQYNYADPQTLNFGGSFSGSSSASYTNNGGNGSIALRATKTYTYNYPAGSYGTSPGSTSFSATVSGAYNGVTPSKSVFPGIPARPYDTPDPLTNVQAVIESDGTHTVSWTRHPTSQGPYDTITIQRREYEGSTFGDWSTVATSGGSVNSRNLSGGTTNRVYQYRARAVNDAGWSAYVDSNNVYNKPSAPSAVNATANLGPNTVSLSWTDNAYISSSVYHEVQRSSGGGAWTTISGAIPQGTSNYTDNTPVPGENTYRVRTYTTQSNLYSSYVQSNSVTTIVAPSTPTSIVPANGATVTKPNPQLSGTLAAISSGQTQKMEWQIASNSGFTTGITVVTESSSDLNASGVHTESPTIANLLLANGTWWIRGRAIDQYGTPSNWSSGNSFTVNTPALPTPTSVTPASGASVTTMTPTLGATVVADGAGRLQRIEWQIASNSGFTSNVRTLTQIEAVYKLSGATSSNLPASLKLTSNVATTWYIRARALGEDGSTSSYTAGTSFTLAMAAPPTPTLTLPASGATVTTSEPTLGATLGAATEGRRSVAEWQLATNSGFTTNVRTIKESSSDLRTSGTATEVIPSGSKLFQSTWYIRVRAVDEYGQAGSYSASYTFVVAHKPVALPVSPIDSTTFTWNTGSKTFSWSVSDPYPNDSQTAYQIIVERNDTGAVLLDTGKISSTSSSASIASTAPLLKDVQMRWKVRVWDTDDVAGGYSSYSAFYLSDLPVVTITAPTNGGSVGTGAPTVTWTLDGATTQYSRRVVFSGSGVNFDTGYVITTSQTYTPPVTILSNGMSYSVTVYVTDIQGLTGSKTNNFTTAYVAPDQVIYVVDDSNYEDGGYISIDWSGMQADGFFVEWHLYRRILGENEWTLLESYTDQNTNSYHDWIVSNGLTYEYAVTQLAGRSGEILESSIQTPALQASSDGSHYWLINPFDESDNVKITGVKADSFSDEYETAELIVIGRGRKINQGTRYGYSGELQAQLRNEGSLTAREKRERLQAIKNAQVTCYLRTPFGDIFQIGVGNLSFSRVAGTGTNEFVDVTIPYAEVY